MLIVSSQSQRTGGTKSSIFRVTFAHTHSVSMWVCPCTVAILLKTAGSCVANPYSLPLLSVASHGGYELLINDGSNEVKMCNLLSLALCVCLWVCVIFLQIHFQIFLHAEMLPGPIYYREKAIQCVCVCVCVCKCSGNYIVCVRVCILAGVHSWSIDNSNSFMCKGPLWGTCRVCYQQRNNSQCDNSCCALVNTDPAGWLCVMSCHVSGNNNNNIMMHRSLVPQGNSCR